MSAHSFEFSFRLGPSQPSDGTRLSARPFDSFPLGGQDYWVQALRAAGASLSGLQRAAAT